MTSQVAEAGSVRASVGGWVASHRWVWAYLAAALAWLAIGAANHRLDLSVLGAVFSLAPFVVLVGIGQMFVITLGNGHTDLTVPNIVALSAFVATSVAAAAGGNALVGILVAIGAGLVSAAISSLVIVGLKVPSMVATLAVGLILQSATTEIASRFPATPDPGLAHFTHLRVAGVSVLGLVCVVVALVFGFVLQRTVFGRESQAVGQNQRAAELSGVPVTRVILVTYAISGCLAALAGALIGSFSSPSLGVGEPYLLNSIAVVVLGGTLISGGRSNVPGVWGAALFLLLLTALLNTLSIPVATQDIVKGVLIILVLALVGTKKQR